MTKSPTLLDLFCGAGGISHGFLQAGFRVVGGVDFDEAAVATFSANHPGTTAICADMSEVSADELASVFKVRRGELDCIAGGPPCQGFSRNRAFRHKDGEFVDDPRNHLYWHFFEFVDYLRPKVVVMENVPEILIKKNGYFKEAVFKRFEACGYAVEARVLNAAEYGVPQWRRRAVFLAGRDNQKVKFPAVTSSVAARAGRRTPDSRDYIEVDREHRQSPGLFDDPLPLTPTVWEAISDLHGEYAADLHGETAYAAAPTSEYQIARRCSAKKVRNHFPWRLTERQLKRIRLLTQGQGWMHLPEELKTKSGYGSAYRRMQADAIALTMTTWMFHPGSGMFTHPFDDRCVTIREAARLQSYQDDFVFHGRYHAQCRQVGNSVAPLLASQIGTAIRTVL